MSHLFEKPRGVETRWASFENLTGERGAGGQENAGAKGHAFDTLAPGESKTLMRAEGSGMITRIWVTVSDRSVERLEALWLEFFWDGEITPAVSVPLGDFFGIALGRRTPFENALFSDPEGRSFNCCVPMPFRTGAKVTLTNRSDQPLAHLFYDVDYLLGMEHSPETLYFHANWRREAPNTLGENFTILPEVAGNGRFLGCNLGVRTDARYRKSWWGEGEVKVWVDDDGEFPTLCGTGTEDYIGTGWGQGAYAHRTQGCPIADSAAGEWAFYRYHIDDPVYFSNRCKVAIQTIGGADITVVRELAAEADLPLIPVTVDAAEKGFHKLLENPQALDMFESGWCNFWRCDEWTATAYYYLDRPA
ncbi:MAG: DUF2961 domain-containing protein [Armatimonas sp.]